MTYRLEDYLEDMLDYSGEWNDPGKYVFQAPILSAIGFPSRLMTMSKALTTT